MALEALKEGHRQALKVAGELEAALGILKRGEVAVAAASVQQRMPFLEQEQQGHFRQEEEGLFLYLVRLTGEGPLQAMAGEHESYWKAVAALKALLPRPGDGAELGRLLEHLVALLRGHIHREETAYFPLVETRLSPRQLQEVDEEIGQLGRAG